MVRLVNLLLRALLRKVCTHLSRKSLFPGSLQSLKVHASDLELVSLLGLKRVMTRCSLCHATRGLLSEDVVRLELIATEDRRLNSLSLGGRTGSVIRSLLSRLLLFRVASRIVLPRKLSHLDLVLSLKHVLFRYDVYLISLRRLGMAIRPITSLVVQDAFSRRVVVQSLVSRQLILTEFDSLGVWNVAHLRVLLLVQYVHGHLLDIVVSHVHKSRLVLSPILM